jgi:hypothetical protein
LWRRERLCEARIWGWGACAIPGPRMGGTGGTQCCSSVESAKGNRRSFDLVAAATSLRMTTLWRIERWGGQIE